MTLRPPQSLQNRDKDPLSQALEQEVFNEKAATLSRLTKKLETALARLAEHDRTDDTGGDAGHRLLLEAGEALWHVTIQRELCGLREHKAFYDFLGVPGAVRLRMGPVASFTKK
ncbi:DUF6665 family protein [Roseibium aggregatum]|uniref:Uncharacterized protein n=1 Tax=Roseibium aggregatum TaxID=187304 RepID=A0A939J793_9HYPH|nr:DUF6665 family protein [Roseibium aggregatum]MBN9673589.1 hypothetical protein [Roseibium aggregatum]